MSKLLEGGPIRVAEDSGLSFAEVRARRRGEELGKDLADRALGSIEKALFGETKRPVRSVAGRIFDTD